MNTYTPGPWNQIVKMEGFTAVGAKTLIARVFSGIFRDTDNERANAHLIAAAPDLLHSLKWLMSMLECGTLVRNIERDAEQDYSIRMAGFVMNLKKAEAAIAKAEDR